MHTRHHLRTGLSNVIRHPILRTAHPYGPAHAHYRVHCWLLSLAFVLCGLVGSSGMALAGPIIAESEDTGGGAGLVLTPNQRVATRLFDEVFSQQKPDVCVLLMAATAINHTPAGAFEGPAGFEQYVAGVRTAYPDASFTFDHGVIDGDLVTVHWRLTDGQMEASGPLEGTAILRFERNMIAESWIEYGAVAPAERAVVTPAAPETCPPCREP